MSKEISGKMQSEFTFKFCKRIKSFFLKVNIVLDRS